MSLPAPSVPYFKLGGLYHLTIGELYQPDCIRDIKQELEAVHGVRLRRATTENEIVFICCNGVYVKRLPGAFKEDEPLAHLVEGGPMEGVIQAGRCGYYVKFSIQFRIIREVYKLQSFNLTHLSSCEDHCEAAFLKNRRELSLLTGPITKMLASKRANNQQFSHPVAIMNSLCHEMGLDPNFMYRNVHDLHYRRKLKKKLDNVIAEARKNQHDLLMNKRRSLSTIRQSADENHHPNQGRIDAQQLGARPKLASSLKTIEPPYQKISSTKKTQSNTEASLDFTTAPRSKQLTLERVSSTASICESSQVDPCEIDPCLLFFPVQVKNELSYPFDDNEIQPELEFLGNQVSKTPSIFETKSRRYKKRTHRPQMEQAQNEQEVQVEETSRQGRKIRKRLVVL